MKTVSQVIMTLLVSILVVGCGTTKPSLINQPTALKQKSIVILYENDVHCEIDGYAQLRGLADAILKSDTSYVGIVSNGDYLQGALAGAISRGQYIVDIMKNVGYDAITLGNHEFDYGTPRMVELLPQIGVPVVSTNFSEYGATTPMYPPYVIKQYGNKRIAFVGTTTPETLRSESYSFFDKTGKQLYDLHTSQVYQLVQQAADKARAEGADYVVVLSHLGESGSEEGVTSLGLVSATRGINAVLDGHTHAVIPGNYVANLDGQQVPVSQTGTQFANIGKLWISPNGAFVTSLVKNADIPYSNARVAASTDSIKAILNQVTSREVATVTFDLPVKDANSVWIVRKEEAPMGNLVADAFRSKMKAQIGLINGGGLRNDIKAGRVNYGNAVSVQPFDNRVCMIEATGQQIMDMLVKCTANCPGLDGSFPQVSGMKYTIHTASHTVTDVQVENASGQYEPLELAKKYTIATTDYYENGGFYYVLKDCRLVEPGEQLSRDVLADYLEKDLKGVVGDEYRTVQGRITIVND